MKLFIDTTFGITAGLVDANLEWKQYKYIEGQKGSAVIHSLIDDLLSLEGIEARDIEALIQVSGPGSYTGMRVAQGIADIFEWQKFPVFSFYHFEVPKLLGESKGIWITNAFKGESFIYKWDGDIEEKSLVKNEDMDISSDIPAFVLKNKESESFIETHSLIHRKPQELFSKVIDLNLKRELYYFRTIEMEFKKEKV